MQKNNFLFSIKGIAAYFVIFIHCLFPSRLGVCMETIARFAVPLFFMASGFYSFGKNNGALKMNLLKTLKLVFIANIIYIGYFVFSATDYISVKHFLIDIFSFKNIAKFFVFNEAFSPAGFHLWFLSALLFCYATFMTVNKFQLIKFLPVFTILLLGIHFILGELFSFMAEPLKIVYVRNCWFMGMPFFMIGYLLKQYEHKIKAKNISYPTLFILVLLGAFLSVTERHFAGKNELYVGSCIMALSFFTMAIKFPDKYSGNLIETLGNKYSLFIYIAHPIIIKELTNSFRYFPNLTIYLQYGKPILVCIVTTIAAYLFYEILNSITLIKKTRLITRKETTTADSI